MKPTAIDTTIFVLGPEKGKKLIDSLPGTSALLVSHDGRDQYVGELAGKSRTLLNCGNLFVLMYFQFFAICFNGDGSALFRHIGVDI